MPWVVAVSTWVARVAAEGCSQARSKEAGQRWRGVAVLAMFRRSVGETPRAREVRWMQQMLERRRRRQHPEGLRGLLLGRNSSSSDRALFLASVVGASPTLQQMGRGASLKVPAAATRAGMRVHVAG